MLIVLISKSVKSFMVPTLNETSMFRWKVRHASEAAFSLYISSNEGVN